MLCTVLGEAIPSRPITEIVFSGIFRRDGQAAYITRQFLSGIPASMNRACGSAGYSKLRDNRLHNRHRKEQFKNRLFDRDTLLLFHYDVNFLLVLSLYARANTSQKADWKRKVRNKFREEIQDWLQDDFDFYAMAAKPGVDARQYFKTHFQDVLGKTYTPFADNDIFSLALDKEDPKESNASPMAELEKFFFITWFPLKTWRLTGIRMSIRQKCIWPLTLTPQVDLDASKLDSTKKGYTPKSRYDAQYAIINELTNND